MCIHQNPKSITVTNPKAEEGSGRDCVILLSRGGWALITDDFGGGKKCQKIYVVICDLLSVNKYF